ncbi:hypothetical protein FRC16_010931 [Serendipita sp. 398]|nr:hypothetical protein FRC16_010931 [Serendipita sp. 398]
MSSTESGSDAPEVVSLRSAKAKSKEQSKREAKRKEMAAHIKKERNQERDARLKARKKAKEDNHPPVSQQKVQRGRKMTLPVTNVDSKSSSEDEEEHDKERARLLARMDRAMIEAEQEGETTEDEEAIGGEENDFDRVDGHQGASMPDYSLDGSSSENEGEGSDDSKMEEDDQQEGLDYLPDHYFTKAATPSDPSSQTKSKPAMKRKKAEKVKRRRNNRIKRQNLLVGSRTIRTLTSVTSAAAVGRTTPSSKTNKFLKKKIKGNLRTRGWERRSVITGLLASRSGPAHRFVRT